MVQEAGIATLAGIGVRVMTSRGDDLTDSDDEMRVAMRQTAGVFSQLEKTRLVKKLRAARERKRHHSVRPRTATGYRSACSYESRRR
jgi:DNA invertase Pin-like site-specific DNA recombinase